MVPASQQKKRKVCQASGLGSLRAKMKKLFLLTGIIWLFLNYSIVFAEDTPPSYEEAKRIMARGKQIAEYERATIRATDMLLEKKPDREKTGVYFAIKKDNRWWVYFGKISEDQNSFALGYSYVCPDGLYQSMKEAPNEEVDTNMIQFARAIKSAFSSIEQKHHRYNPNVFRERDGTITVYITPGNETKEVRLGGDYKVSVSPDGLKALNVAELHRALLVFPEHRKTTVSSWHTHLKADLPAETDVAAVLLDPSLAPHIVVGPKWITEIDEGGKIRLIGRTEQILKPQGVEK